MQKTRRKRLFTLSHPTCKREGITAHSKKYDISKCYIDVTSKSDIFHSFVVQNTCTHI